MSDQFSFLTPKLINCKLPVLDSLLERFNMLLDRPATTNRHLAEIVQADIGFSVAILRATNRQLRTKQEPIINLEHALSMLGMAKVKSLIKSLVPISGLPEDSQHALKQLYSQAHHTSHYFFALSVQTHLSQAHEAEAEMASRLMNLAAVLLWTHHPDKMLELKKIPDGFQITESEQAAHTGLRQLSLDLAKKWYLPVMLSEALDLHEDSKPVPRMMALANAIAITSSHDWYAPGLTPLLEVWSESSELSTDSLQATLHRIAAETARQIDQHALPLPAFFLIQPKRKPAKKAKKTAAKPTPANPLQEALTRQMKNMRQFAGVERVLFAMLTPDKQQLKVRFVLGCKKDDPFKNFIVDVTDRNLFSLLLQKPQGIWLQTGNQDKYRSLVPVKQRTSMKTDNLFAMSVFINDKPIGLVVADSSKPLIAAQYKQFKYYCKQAANDLSKNRKSKK